jgi:hypothetical protein
LVLASKRIHYNQKKTDEIGFLKNHAPIVGCRTDSSLGMFKPMALMATFFGNIFNEFFQNSLVLISGNFHHFFWLEKAIFFELMFFIV